MGRGIASFLGNEVREGKLCGDFWDRFMKRRIVLRLVDAVATTLGATLLVFIALQVLPGNYVRTLTSQVASGIPEEQIQQMERDAGVDRPIIAQLPWWWARMFRGDFGTSLYHLRPTLSLWARAAPVTLQLAIMALVAAVLAGVSAGLISAVYKDKPVDYLVRAAARLGTSAPDFWVGTLILLYSSLVLGYAPPKEFAEFTESPLRNLQHMAIPAAVLGYRLAAPVTLMARDTMLDVLGQNYMRTAYAKGLSRNAAITRHALKNVMLRVVPFVGGQVGLLMGGVVVVETLFHLPGIGLLTYDSLYLRDYPQVQTQVLFFVIIVVLSNLMVAVLHGLLDPRIRRS